MVLSESVVAHSDPMKGILISFCLLVLMTAVASPADRPNMQIIKADDCTYNDLPVYGG